MTMHTEKDLKLVGKMAVGIIAILLLLRSFVGWSEDSYFDKRIKTQLQYERQKERLSNGP